ncbi:MAG: SDR family oxidoreductase [Acidobacteriota bacterium]
MKVTVITGASSGIGEAFSRRLAGNGHDLVLVARSENKLHELCDELMLKHKIMAHYVALDLLEDDADEKLLDETSKHNFEVDWLINNAGFGSMGDFATLDLEKELDIIRLNVSSLVAMTHRFLPQMRERKRGTVINVSSSAGFQPIPFMATYAATKAFVTSFTEAVAEENRPFGIRTMALCPGATRTNFFAASDIKEPLKVKGEQSPEEVVDAALKGLKRGKNTVISGWANYIGSMLGKHVPDSVSTRVVARALRPKYQENE